MLYQRLQWSWLTGCHQVPEDKAVQITSHETHAEQKTIAHGHIHPVQESYPDISSDTSTMVLAASRLTTEKMLAADSLPPRFKPLALW